MITGTLSRSTGKGFPENGFQCRPVRFPKTARLLKSRDFRFDHFRRFHTDLFTFIYTTKGQGRLGVSLSKKVLKRAVARNRVRRLIREAYRLRHDRLLGLDIHVIGKNPLWEHWQELKRSDLEAAFDALASHY